jgi:O-antigen ligase
MLRPEFWLVAMANAGSFKSHPIFDYLPFDFVLLAFGMLFLLIIARTSPQMRWGRGMFLTAFAIVPFLAYYCGRTLGSGSTEGTKQAILLVGMCGPAFVIALFWTAQLWPRARHFLAAQAMLALILSIPCIAYRFLPAADLNSDQIPGFNDSITLSTAIAIGAVAFVLRNFSASFVRFGIRFMIVLAVMLIALLANGAKGPLFAAILSIGLVVLVWHMRWLLTGLFKSAHLFFAICAGLAALCTLAVLQPGRMVTLTRIFLAFSEESASVSSRAERLSITSALWKKAPVLGHGPGSSEAVLGAHYGAPDYPHNIVLELLADTGVVGLILFMPIGLAAFYGIFGRTDSSRRHAAVSAGACALCALLCATTSGKFTDHRQLFLFSGATCGVLTAVGIRSVRNPGGTTAVPCQERGSPAVRLRPSS